MLTSSSAGNLILQDKYLDHINMDLDDKSKHWSISDAPNTIWEEFFGMWEQALRSFNSKAILSLLYSTIGSMILHPCFELKGYYAYRSQLISDLTTVIQRSLLPLSFFFWHPGQNQQRSKTQWESSTMLTSFFSVK